MKRLTQNIACLALAIMAGACSGIDLGRPQAFPRDAMDSTRIAAIAETVPLAVLPPTGLAPGEAQAVAAAVANALTTAERPALAGRRGGPTDVLTGDIQIVSGRTGQTLVARWRLMPLKQSPRDVSVRVPLDAAETPGPAAWERLAAATVAALAAPPARTEAPAPAATAGDQATLSRDASATPVDDPAPVLPLPPVAVQEAEGAPGDGPAALAGAMRRELARFGFPAGTPGQAGSFVVAPEVRVSPGGMTESVRIDWVVRDPEGVEAGRITQENAVPAGALVPRWGEVALLAAQAAALSVGEMVAAAQEQRAADAALRAKPPADR